VPYTLVLGNHDLEGEEFETDREYHMHATQ
jgi:hypothetical protein